MTVATADPPIASRRDIGVLPARRVLAVDPGRQSIKVVLAEEMFGRLRVLSRDVLELRPEGASGDEESLQQAQLAVQAAAQVPVALALPHYHAISQIVDLPSTEASDVKAAIDEETVKLSGLGESAIVHDYSSLGAFGRYENPFWVTLCQEAEIQRQIARCGASHLDLCEVTTSANALIAAYQWVRPDADRVALVDFGASGTTVALLLDGQPVYCASFPLGSQSLAPAAGPAPDPEEGLTLTEPLRRWHGELIRVVREWLLDHPELHLELAQFEFVLAGGVATQSGVAGVLNSLGSARFIPWPTPESEDAPDARFAVALGAALHALGRAPQMASLLPDEVRVYWNRHHSLQVVHSLLCFLLLLLVLALGVGTWQKYDLLRDKAALLQQGQVALRKSVTTRQLAERAAVGYEDLRVVLQRQRQTVDVVQTLAALQQVRSNQAFWLVLVADTTSYYSEVVTPATNAPAATNEVASTPATVRPGFVIELCVPEQGETRRRIVSQIVQDLRRLPVFRNVDSLADDRRRALADPAVLLPDGHVALELELASSAYPGAEPSNDRRAVPQATHGGERGPAPAAPGAVDRRGSGAAARSPVRSDEGDRNGRTTVGTPARPERRAAGS